MTTPRRLTTGIVAGLAALALTGCSAFEVSDAGHTDAAHDEESSPPIEGATEQTVTAEALAFEPGSIEVRAGEPVNISLTSVDTLHDLIVDEVDFHLAADHGDTSAGGLLIDEPGSYVGYCSVPGHRDAGMELQISVG